MSQSPPIDGPEAEKVLFDLLNEAEQAKLADKEEFHFAVVSARRTQTEERRADILIVQRQFEKAGVCPLWYVDEPSLEDYRALGLEAKVGGKLIPARNLALDDAKQLGKVRLASGK